MDSTPGYTDTLQKIFSEYLKNRKLRNTVERSTIFATVCQTKDLFTLEMVGQRLEEKKFHVSRASIHNTINLLLEAQIVVRHQFTGMNVQYELKHLAEKFNHAICTHCGAVRKIKNDKKTAVFADYKIPKFTVEYATLHFYGICSKCKFRQIQKNRKHKSKLDK